jgi:hypothetical protein
MSVPTSNADETLITVGQNDALFIGNFHKTLPHNEYGEVVPAAYHAFRQTCLDIEAGSPINFEMILQGLNTYPQSPFAQGADADAIKSGAKFTSPLAGAATEKHGPDPKILEMPPAPGILSLSTAAEMVELYWMALLRDKPLELFATADSDVQAAVNDIEKAFSAATDPSKGDQSPGRLKLTLDLPQKGGAIHIMPETLFRCGLRDEEIGPLVSQFFIRDIPYGVQTIDQRLTPYVREKNFLTNQDDWLLAQNTGKDKWGRDYGSCNNYADQVAGRETYYPQVKRYISTMRDLARFVNRDALHQAYFNAALFLDAIGAPLDSGNPYNGVYSREGGFATLGGPDLLTLVSEVASRALKVVWRQKWLVHRRARPEVYGGLLEMQMEKGRMYGLPDLVSNSDAAKRIKTSCQGTYFLPMAFSAGSPAHPAYGAGHATVAGACVTVLKAWFDEDAKLGKVICEAQIKSKEPGAIKYLLKPGQQDSKDLEVFSDPEEYCDSDPAAMNMTVGGELNKIASNVAMGRSMGGVHWRSDNTRSLRLGEKIAIEILRKRTMEYAERPVSFTFHAFDQHTVQISQGQVIEY